MNNSKRIQSLDFFRGITIAAMILVNNPGSWSFIYTPFKHAEWHGWTPTDLIFPFFLFIVGVSITLAMNGKKERNEPKVDIYKRVIRRTVILFALGLFLAIFPYFNFEGIRIFGVLQRIAVCYLIATVIFMHASYKAQIIWTLSLLFLYWGLMELYPVPGIGAGLYEAAANFSNYVDSILLEGHVWSVTKTWDPEGIISTLPAISTTLFGVLTGHIFIRILDPLERIKWILILGSIMIILGLTWGIWLPINKNLWTSSYAVFSSGMAMVIFGFSFYFIDIKKRRFAVKPFVVYGMNAITVFVASGIVARLLLFIKWTDSEEKIITLKSWIFDTFFLSWLSPINASLLYAIFFIALFYLMVLLMYKRNLFIKI